MSQSSQNASLGKDAIDPAANLSAIKTEIEDALKEAGRPAESVVITAVSKQHDLERIRPVLNVGHRVFGENRVQEAMSKWPKLREEFSGIELRLIGPLQTNKVKEAVAFFDVIESIDRPKLAAALAKEMEKQSRRPRLLIQVNTGDEAQKAGVSPKDADAFLKECKKLGLDIEGLMCIPPVKDDPAPHFALLEKIAARNGLKKLSMGMSGDYLLAAQLGATHLRIGSAIFGPRPKKP
ncbi:YggS family pyridoxal phosphate-dependent enzyme [Hyphococcus flavus]|uniref:Pyridoxal phosphate homeostasis protein n=1 Tax=Hyphococcus flavus TaxID=1866326 RepID=A0AAF0CGR9_9PROT|nr:YggS family pyridoxal phosphate-dependent enzyme [Hyphococcus flavus]WDI32789.1 YggS family pyridoxal phosphate-dependent enzyme [Hyphococcus flavus]